MAQQLLCDNPGCVEPSKVIPLDVERMDVFLTSAARERLDGGRDLMNFHWGCWCSMSAPQPASGVSLTLRRFIPAAAEQPAPVG